MADDRACGRWFERFFRQRFRVDGGFFKFDIQSDDGGGAPDEDFNDLVVTAAKPLNSGEWIVYGTARSYSGFCHFNPCFPFPWY